MILFRFEAHLINEHGALFDIEFLIKVSLYKSQHSSLPELQIDPQPKVKRLYINISSNFKRTKKADHILELVELGIFCYLFY